jgi:hypothetical protein
LYPSDDGVLGTLTEDKGLALAPESTSILLTFGVDIFSIPMVGLGTDDTEFVTKFGDDTSDNGADFNTVN